MHKCSVEIKGVYLIDLLVLLMHNIPGELVHTEYVTNERDRLHADSLNKSPNDEGRIIWR